MSGDDIQKEYRTIAKENGIEGTLTAFGTSTDLIAPAAEITRDGSGGDLANEKGGVVRSNYNNPTGGIPHEILHTLGVGDSGYNKGGLLNSPPHPIISSEARDALKVSYKKKDEE